MHRDRCNYQQFLYLTRGEKPVLARRKIGRGLGARKRRRRTQVKDLTGRRTVHEWRVLLCP